jgi:hypothetical protein
MSNKHKLITLPLFISFFASFYFDIQHNYTRPLIFLNNVGMLGHSNVIHYCFFNNLYSYIMCKVFTIKEILITFLFPSECFMFRNLILRFRHFPKTFFYEFCLLVLTRYVDYILTLFMNICSCIESIMKVINLVVTSMIL